jgi:hypothetical protein
MSQVEWNGSFAMGIFEGSPWLEQILDLQGFESVKLPDNPLKPVDICDQIDELVNDQLANYPQRSGYDFPVNQEKCGHCGRAWHGLKITQLMEMMRQSGRYDESYRYDTDDSSVICPGSEFIGPIPNPYNDWIQISEQYVNAMMAAGFGIVATLANVFPAAARSVPTEVVER